MTFIFSGALLRFTDYQREVALEAPSIAAALQALVLAHPPLRPVLYDGAGQLRTVHRLFLNGEQLDGAELERALASSDRLEVLTAIAGG